MYSKLIQNCMGYVTLCVKHDFNIRYAHKHTFLVVLRFWKKRTFLSTFGFLSAAQSKFGKIASSIVFLESTEFNAYD